MRTIAASDDMSLPYFTKTLLVEDQGLTRRAMKALLRLSDPHLVVDEARDFASCIACLAGGGHQLLFLDYQLGAGGSGLDVLRWIQERELAVRTVMLSAVDDRQTVLACIQAGASGFISKCSDGDGDVFRTAIETILRGQIYLPRTALDRGRGGAAAAVDALALSPRLAETLGYICQGLSNKGIARKMILSEHTVKEYSSDLLGKFGVRKRTELIVEMARRGIVIPRA